MTRHLAIAFGLAALALPALAQDRPYDYQDENGSAWSDEPPPPDEGSYSEYPAEDSRVDVNVDIGAPGASVSFDSFRDGLAPYGEWVTVNGYGRVWRPANVAAGWRPYYYGRWEWTDEGWLWVSDESWGWATYHYGRWAMDPSYGWVWVPGYQWAPAWVTWRYSPDYIGWAPLGPGFSVYVTSYPINYAWWSFVPCNRFVGVPVFSVAFTGAHVRGIFHNTYPAPPRATVFGAPAPAWGGPARPFIERRVGHAIAPVRVQPVGSPGAMAGAARGGVVPIYRPEARPAPGGRPSAVAPSRPWGPAPGRGPAVAAPRQGAPVQPQGGGVRPVDPRRSGGWRGNPQSAPPQGAPRQYVPAPQGGPRQYAPPPQQQRYAPGPQGAPRQYAPAPQGGPRYAPAPQGGPRYAPAPQGAPRQYAPAPQGGSAPRPQAAPQGQHGGGGGGGHGSAQAPAHRRD